MREKTLYALLIVSGFAFFAWIYLIGIRRGFPAWFAL